MLCPNCEKECNQGKYCGYCGAPLDEEKRAENQADQLEAETGQAEVNAVSRQAEKGAGNWYLEHFIRSIKSPFVQAGEASGKKESIVAAAISMIAFSLLVPLVVYAYVKSLLVSFGLMMSGFGGEMDMDISVSAYVMKPFFFLLCLLALLSVFIWAAVRLWKKTIRLSEIFSEYGSLLIPMSLVVLVAEILALAGMGGSVYILSLGLVSALYLLPAAIILRHGKAAKRGLDPIYAIMATYVMTGIVVYFITRIAMNSMLEQLTNYLQWYM